MSVEGQFFLSVTGSIEHAEFYDADNAYCKYGFHFGPEWSVVAVSIPLVLFKFIRELFLMYLQIFNNYW